jgi:putative hemolysin
MSQIANGLILIRQRLQHNCGRAEILELGRTSIDRERRTPEVPMLLWRGIARYATEMGLRYLLGCSSLNSNDPAVGWQMVRQLENFRVRELSTMPTTDCARPWELQDADAQPLPCQTDRSGFLAPLAWDREFRTIDFLMLLDLKLLSAAARNRFLAPLTS